ncbi:flagellin [Curtobacterium sp. MCBD17_034]|uniref:flagellin N-terminal helical domain-containing protein n=1 Tax=unclassified Curtobacterium TaxID=257496 RepID=UPI000DA9AA7A|nr:MULTISPECIES: flagellin [unclassified Curtobacterium]PZF60841.1 flagellin [Curtobacterium sp. MCBD17_034]PZF66422.1 flagellin [Curtobacterium sp. MCBD17_013]PZM40190.1 flagellin [Curtobacterium sp. MCBD17_031]WIB64999.1 flagellin [Curtobacterium sp. MCBD17_040]
MGMSINTNLSALDTYRNLNATQNDLSNSLEKLSSGLRINKAADDAAGLSISEGLKSQVGGLTVAARNAQDGISVVQTAEGGLTEVHSILQRMRDLAVQAGNDSNNADSRTAITTEVSSLQSELSRIASSTNFNGTSLLNSNSTLKFQVGANGDANSQISVDLSGANVNKVVDALGATQSDGTAFTIKSGTNINTAFQGKSLSFEAGKGTSSDLKVTTGTLTGSNADGTFTSVDDLVSSLNGDATFSKNFTATAVKDVNGATTGFNVRANDGSAVDTVSPLGTADTTGTLTGAAGSSTTGLQFDTADHAQAAIRAIDAQITAVSTARSNLGAVQNRFDHAINVTNVAKENLTAAQSRITDVDMAEEMVNYTRDNILSQAGTAMLAQANQSTQGVLSLLK